MGSIKSNLMPMSAVKQEMQSLHFPVIKEFRFFWNKVNKIRLQALLKSHLALKFKQLNNIFIIKEINVSKFRLACSKFQLKILLPSLTGPNSHVALVFQDQGI